MNPYSLEGRTPKITRMIKKHRADTESGQLWAVFLKPDLDVPPIKKFNCTVQPLGEQPNALDGDQTMDKWYITLQHGEQMYSFEYFTGLGHRIEPHADKRGQPMRILTMTQRNIVIRKAREQGYKSGYNIVIVKSSTGHGDSTYGKQPNLADILYCLLSDRTHGESFDDWASNFGYDTDSRKAHDIYLACQRSEGALSKLFNRTEIEQIETILEDF